MIIRNGCRTHSEADTDELSQQMKPTFEPTEDGLEIIDRIERHRYRLTTHEPVSAEPVDCDRIQYPVDAAVRITTSMITLPSNNHIYIRGSDGTMVVEVKPDQQTFLPEGEYTIDLSGPLKVYAQVDDSVQVYSDPEQTHISLGETSPVIIGARSRHTRPARTITTTPNPNDVMQAVSIFGSALKTTSAERSYPTLRGHPPAVKLGSELAIPDELERPATGVKIEVPPTLNHVFVVAPLAYYLGAEIVPGPEPRLTTETGYSRTLSGEGSFESIIRRILHHVFFLDCVVRTEGITPLPLHERDSVEPILGFDIESIYEKSLPEQLETYFDVPFSAVEPYLPEWRLETQLKPKKETIEFLPFISNRLAAIDIQTNDGETQLPKPDQTQAISDFTRNRFVRSSNSVRTSDTTSEAITVPDLSTIRQVWSSQGTSEIVSTTPLSAFETSIGRNPRADPIEIKVICNDVDMDEELESVNETYGNREELPFDVTVHHDVTTTELKQLLATESDFLHYIGHIDSDGFQCSDGKLDGATLESTNVKAFLLNACQSYNQGFHLIEAGSIGGIVTLGNVVNSGAIRIGNTIARLLNRGFSLYSALDIARNESVVGQQYHIVGDGMITIAQSEADVPNLCILDENQQEFSIQIKTYNSVMAEQGSVFTPYLDPIDTYNIVPGKTAPIPVRKDQLEKFLNQGQFPVLLNGTVYWSDDILIS